MCARNETIQFIDALTEERVIYNIVHFRFLPLPVICSVKVSCLITDNAVMFKAYLIYIDLTFVVFCQEYY